MNTKEELLKEFLDMEKLISYILKMPGGESRREFKLAVEKATEIKARLNQFSA